MASQTFIWAVPCNTANSLTKAMPYYIAFDMTIACTAPATMNTVPSVSSERERIRNRHHDLARSEALGQPPQVGWSPSTLAILRTDPAFCNLVLFYRRTLG